MNITVDLIRKMKKAGFSDPQRDKKCAMGTAYYYQGREYIIGRSPNGKITDFDREVAEKGEWLPNQFDLFEWLYYTDFKVTVIFGEEHIFYVKATDLVNGKEYSACSLSLDDTLACVIRKICKSGERDYTPRPALIIEVLDEDD